MSEQVRESGTTDQGPKQGANITYLRHLADTLPNKYGDELNRACDDIEGYRELVGLVISRDDPERLKNFLKVMTWGNGFTEEDYDRAVR